MNFKCTNLLGGPYRGGNLLFNGTELLSPVGNRVHKVDLATSTSCTLPLETNAQLSRLALSPSGELLLCVDEKGRCLLAHLPRRVVLHRFSFKDKVGAAQFSPDGRWVAVGVGRLVQVWHAPGLARSMAPMQLHRTYGQFHSAVTSLDWAADSAWLAASSADLTVRVFSLDPPKAAAAGKGGVGSGSAAGGGGGGGASFRPPALAGHKDKVVAVWWAGPKAAEAARLEGKPPPVLFSVGRDGALFCWGFTPDTDAGGSSSSSSSSGGEDSGEEEEGSSSGEGEERGEAAGRAKRRRVARPSFTLQPWSNTLDNVAAATADGGLPSGRRRRPWRQTDTYARGSWGLLEKHLLWQRGASVSAADYHAPSGMLVLGYSSGLFDLYQLPGATHVQSLSISREAVTSARFGGGGEWLALGCARLGQLLVWEWRSETYALKQQGHYHDVAAASFSPDGAYLVTGADDSKVKVWNLLSGFCFVTFTDHAAPVTATRFLPSGHAVLSASLDGTVRAYDLVRYRNFRTLTSPRPAQFISLAVDPAGEIVVAGAQDEFSVYVWSLKTGRLLDVLAGHEGPVCGLAFNPAVPMLASCSWDRTVRTWDVFGGKGAVEALQHSHDVLAIAFHPAGKQLASSTLDGTIWFWDPEDAALKGTIEGRRDVAGGRSQSDRRSASNRASGHCFSSLQYSADGAFLLAGGASKWVCMYDAEEKVMLRRFQISVNQSLDGVLDMLNSKNMTDAGPAALLDDEPDEWQHDELLPPSAPGGAAAEHDLPGTGSSKQRRSPAIRTRAVSLSPTGRCFCAATTEGVVMYSADEALMFDPSDLGEDVTPQAVRRALSSGSYLVALLMAMRLNDPECVRDVVMGTPPDQVRPVAEGMPAGSAPQLLVALAEQLDSSAHLEFLLTWVRELCTAHGPALQQAAAAGVGGGGAGAARVLPVLRTVQKVVTRLHDELSGMASDNLYTLQYLASCAPLPIPEQQ